MKLKQACMVLFLSAILCGCKDTASVTRVTFLEKGAVVPDPISTTVIIRPDSIKSYDSESGVVSNQWSSQILASEFSAIQEVITENDLFHSEDVTSNGQHSCLGMQGTIITINKSGISHSFEIKWDVICNDEYWPEGVRELVNLEKQLVAKYSN